MIEFMEALSPFFFVADKILPLIRVSGAETIQPRPVTPPVSALNYGYGWQESSLP